MSIVLCSNMTLMYGKNANYLHKNGEERALGGEEHERKEDEQEKKR